MCHVNWDKNMQKLKYKKEIHILRTSLFTKQNSFEQNKLYT